MEKRDKSGAGRSVFVTGKVVGSSQQQRYGVFSKKIVRGQSGSALKRGCVEVLCKVHRAVIFGR